MITMLQKILCAAFLMYCISTNVVFSGEAETKNALIIKHINLFTMNEFDELNSLAEQYRVSKERTSSGYWMLSRLYGTLEKHISFEHADEKDSFWLERKTTQFLKEHPESPSAIILRAIYLEARAWNYRGGGWAKDVPPEAWKPFKEKLREADKFLLDHKDIAKTDPQWYAVRTRIQVALYDEPKDFLESYEEGLAKYPDYYQIYFSAVFGLMSKWHGNPRYIENLAQSAVENTAKTEGNAVYTRIYWFLSQNLQKHEDLFVDYNVNWVMMTKGMQDILDAYPDQWNVQNFAYFACKKKDRQITRLLMGRITGKPHKDVWGTNKLYKRCEKL